MFNETLEISVLLLMFLVEALVAALVAVALLFVLNRAKKVLVEKLMARLSELDNDPEAIELEADEFSEADTALVNAETEQHEQNYQQYLEDALLYTKDYHQLCFNTDKITLDKDESVDQQIIALRHN
ncbi:MAG: hypothetical protein HOM11_12450, partial [Methylococcales bacterium]|nr:hypothetical protein [Methylococcales bacterium]